MMYVAPLHRAPAGFATRALALARLETPRALRSRMTLLGAVIFAAAHALGRWKGGGSDDFFVIGFVAAYALAFSPGLSGDRRLSFDRLLVLNLLTPGEYAAGKTAAMIAWTVSLGAFAWVAAVLFSAGDVRFASWHTALMTLMGVALLPAVVATDVFMGTRLPAAATLIMVVVLIILLAAFGVEVTQVMAWLGLMVTPYSYASLEPLFLRACIAAPLTVGLVSLAAAARGWRARPAS